jgi:hypothetical protein
VVANPRYRSVGGEIAAALAVAMIRMEAVLAAVIRMEAVLAAVIRMEDVLAVVMWMQLCWWWQPQRW